MITLWRLVLGFFYWKAMILFRPQKYTYLCGAIQSAKDGGVKWREKITPTLEEIGIKVLDPTIEERKDFNGDIKNAQVTLEGWIRSGNWKLWDNYVDKIIDRDLNALVRANFLVVFIDTDVKIGGTIFELIFSILLGKSIYVVCLDSWSSWNIWLLRVCRIFCKLFGSWTELTDHLKAEYGKKVA